MIYLVLLAETAPTSLPPGVGLLPCILTGGATELHPLRPRLRCTEMYQDLTDRDEHGKPREKQRIVYDLKSIKEVAAELRSHGTKFAALDFEPANAGGLSEVNVEIARKIKDAFYGRGVRVDFYGAGDVGQTDPVNLKFAEWSRWLHPNWYPDTRDDDLWERRCKDKLIALRKTFLGKPCAPWLSISSGGGKDNDPDGTPLPVERVRRQLEFAYERCEHVVEWVNLAETVPGGNIRFQPFSADAPYFKVIAEVGARN